MGDRDANSTTKRIGVKKALIANIALSLVSLEAVSVLSRLEAAVPKTSRAPKPRPRANPAEINIEACGLTAIRNNPVAKTNEKPRTKAISENFAEASGARPTLKNNPANITGTAPTRLEAETSNSRAKAGIDAGKADAAEPNRANNTASCNRFFLLTTVNHHGTGETGVFNR